MKNTTKIIVAAICLMFTATTLVSAVESRVQYIKLYEKDPTTWTIVPNGAWGELWASNDNHQIVFKGYKLVGGARYMLISYDEPWPGTGSVIIGTGYANRGGGLQIIGAVSSLVYNVYTTGEYAGQTGAKIWLVLYSDLYIDPVTNIWHFTAWQPTEYLFEGSLIY